MAGEVEAKVVASCPSNRASVTSALRSLSNCTGTRKILAYSER